MAMVATVDGVTNVIVAAQLVFMSAMHVCLFIMSMCIVSDFWPIVEFSIWI